MGLAAAVGGAAVWVVVVVAVSGWRREQVADGEATGLVRSRFWWWQGLAWSACVHVEGTARLWLPLSCDGSS